MRSSCATSSVYLLNKLVWLLHFVGSLFNMIGWLRLQSVCKFAHLLQSVATDALETFCRYSADILQIFCRWSAECLQICLHICSRSTADYKQICSFHTGHIHSLQRIVVLNFVLQIPTHYGLHGYIMPLLLQDIGVLTHWGPGFFSISALSWNLRYFDTWFWIVKRHMGQLLQQNIDKYWLTLSFKLIILWYTFTEQFNKYFLCLMLCYLFNLILTSLH